MHMDKTDYISRNKEELKVKEFFVEGGMVLSK